ncbi:MAG TPA: hypothetical protein VGG03_08700 [Thermoanaerobaculia bacterium]|jgi:hypothetical protein
MPSLSPAIPLDQGTAEAPWCARLDNLEMGLLLLAVPWAAGAGLRRADLERQLASLDLPFGPIYFQRIKRAVARLEEIGALRGSGEGRARRFVVTPEGFAALLLNLCVLHADPTLDGSEFELKRSLVSTLNRFFERLSEQPEEARLSPGSERFFDAVERLTVLGEPVITEEVEGQALDVLRLIAEQRRQVELLLNSVRERQAWEESESGTLSELDMAQRLTEAGFGEAVSLLAADPNALRELATDVFPWLGHSATVLRYEHYLRYLDDLAALYATELKTVGLQSLLAARRAG